jgi:predicted secreted protein
VIKGQERKMKNKLFKLFVLAIAIAFLLLPGCAVAPKHVSVEVACGDFYASQHITDEVHIPVDGTVTLTLCSNPTTGLQWEPTVCCPLRSVILAEVDHKFIPPEETGDMPPAVGVPIEEVWVYKGVNQGTAAVSLDYRRLGQSDERGEWTYNLTVVVE